MPKVCMYNWGYNSDRLDYVEGLPRLNSLKIKSGLSWAQIELQTDNPNPIQTHDFFIGLGLKWG